MEEDIIIPPKGTVPISRGRKNKATTSGTGGEIKRPKRIPFTDRPMLEQKSMPFSIVEDLLHTKSNITIA